VSMLIAALRSDNPLGGAPLSYTEADGAFHLQGVGDIPAAKVLDLENRRQLVWADPVTREWALEMAAMKVRKEKEAAAQAAAQAAEAAAAATAPAGGRDVGPRPTAPAQTVSPAVGETRVFAPPVDGDRRPAGVRAASTRFDAPAAPAAQGGRVVYEEPPVDESATAASVAAAWGVGVTVQAPASGPPAAGDPLAAAWSTSRAVSQAPGEDVVTRRSERRSTRREAEHRKANGAAWLRILVYILIAVAIAVVLFLMQHGTIGF